MISSLELARLCGVSQGTVDRALHDRPGIKPKTRELVLKAAAEHGYRPNPAVRTLLGGESEVVGAVIPRSRSVFFVDLLDAVRVALEERGLRLYSTSASDDAAFIAALDDMAARRMRAIVVVPPREGLPLPKHLTLPIASLLSSVKAPHSLFIAPDEVETGRRATEYLIAKGHRVIWHLTYARSARGIDDRLKGYEQAMRRHGLELEVLRDLSPSSLLARLRRERPVSSAAAPLRGDWPTALFCHNDWLALQAMRLLESEGLRVPEDISVLGVDDSPTFRELFRGLTTLSYPLAAVASAAARWLSEGGPLAPIPALEVVERDTVAPVSL